MGEILAPPRGKLIQRNVPSVHKNDISWEVRPTVVPLLYNTMKMESVGIYSTYNRGYDDRLYNYIYKINVNKIIIIVYKLVQIDAPLATLFLVVRVLFEYYKTFQYRSEGDV